MKFNQLYKNYDQIDSATSQVRGQMFSEQDLAILQPSTLYYHNYNSKHHVELHVYDMNYNYIDSSISTNWLTTAVDGIPRIALDPNSDMREIGFRSGLFRVAYNIHQTVSDGYYIQKISPSRNEVRLRVIDPNSVDHEIMLSKPDSVYDATNLVLNFGQNIICPVIKWEVDDRKYPDYPHSIVLRLYDPLPVEISEHMQVDIHRQVTLPVIEKVILQRVSEEESGFSMSGPNFSVEIKDESPSSIDYKNWDDVLSTYTETSNTLVDRYLSQSVDGIDLNIDYRQYENFVHFGSAVDRLKNFRYKLGLIEEYDNFINNYSSSIGMITGSASGSDAVATNHQWYVSKKRNLITTFDGYERYMYYGSSSYETSSLGEFTPSTWPKSNSNKPYLNVSVNSEEGTSWYSGQLNSASIYDNLNSNRLENFIPLHVKLDGESDAYVTFVNMIAHHFDIILTYIKGLSDIHNRESSVDVGIPKDLVYQVAESMGFDTFGGRNAVDLWKWSLGTNVSGSYAQQGVSGSLSDEGITKEIWSRIVHNIPYLLKTKGTERGIKALLNCYGIPSSILRIREYGGPFATGSSNSSNVIKDVFRYGIGFDRADYIKADIPTETRTIELRFRPYTDLQIPATQSLFMTSDGTYLDLYHNDITGYGTLDYHDSGDNHLESPSLPIFNGDAWSIMIRSGSTHTDLFVKNFGYGKILHQGSSSFDNSGTPLNLPSDVDVYIGSDGSNGGLSGSMQEFRCWSEVLLESAFNNHVGNPSAYNGNSYDSAYNSLTRRFSFNSASDYSSCEVPNSIPSSSNATASTEYYSTSPGWTYESEEVLTKVPMIGATTYNSNKIRIESSSLEYGNLSHEKRSEVGSYDYAPVDSPRLGIYFSPIDPINDDILDQYGDSDLRDMIGDPRDQFNGSYRGLVTGSVDYWKKYGSPNSFWDYMKFIKSFDMSLFRQIGKLIPARANKSLGVMIEPSILERPKVRHREDSVSYEQHHYSSEIDYNIVLSQSSEYLYYESEFDWFDVYSSASSMYPYYEVTFDNTFNPYELFRSSNTVFVTQSTNLSDGTPIIFPYWERTFVETYNTYTGSMTGSSAIGWCTQVETAPVKYNRQKWTLSEYYSKSYGSIQTADTTVDGKSPIEITLTNPNKIIATDTGVSRLKVE